VLILAFGPEETSRGPVVSEGT